MGKISASSVHTAPESVADEPQIPRGLVYGFPTDQHNLNDTHSEKVYQSTASGRIESAGYGSVRTGKVGSLTLPTFHEGLDIAALQRDRRGAPLDRVYAVADGKVVYVNRIAGNSSYGIYVVIQHQDPVGDIFTLYAHLAKVEAWVKAGVPIKRGQDMALMGHTSTLGIPIQRAHLHFEIGTMLNDRFQQWYRMQKQIPDHGNYHGHNLAGIHPLSIYRHASPEIVFSMLDQLRQEPQAFTLLVKHAKPINYFSRYPGLWEGEKSAGYAVLSFSEGGVPVHGRAATPAEVQEYKSAVVAVMKVNEDVLGRNGQRLLVKRKGKWVVGGQGERFLEMLLF